VAVNGTWDAKRLQSLGLVTLVAFQPNGEEVINEGVLLKDLLDAIEPEPNAGRVIFTNANGDRVEMPLDEAQACQECLVAFDPWGSDLHLTMPGLPAELWVRNLVGIELQ
jgi:DMSO/TMAO reductase YedYZ molybdopterin-dependent catalytic subunit